ncbi:condensation domain-containing protein [Mycolicibacterium sarraceniae]|uniref:Fatty acyl-AMP ligase FadD28 and polyketide synthase n=1 Tax=Mycolicibacterium sarraceniae TaxID=1534348 RepID=A0A7I7STY5_9MYCO|nr:hypothetical protein [Mycolicibacterium sarraceniae]BBY59791.1 hypothetical protein MSAR_29270 [Mycolicibacterium sarraceniae]
MGKGLTDASAQPDNLLHLVDQAFYMGHSAAGQQELMQVCWLYLHPVDLDAIRRFHQGLGNGLLGRLIERSPLPFGRYRWVTAGGPTPLDITEPARPRAELSEWFNERARLPLNPESGPGWRLSVLPLTDGSTAITLVISHYVLDGIGAVLSVGEALLGMKRDLNYPPRRSRPQVRGAVQDARQAIRDTLAVGRAIAAAIKEARRRQREDSRSAAPEPLAISESGTDDPIQVPNAWMFVDFNQWEARAAALGGTSSTLAAGFVAKLAERMGRPLGPDGTVAVQLVVNDRTAEDTRAVAVAFTRIRIDPARVTTDLSTARADIKQALKTLKDEPDELSPRLAPLTPFTPKPAWRQMIDWAIDDPDRPVACSILGDVGDVVTRIDGTLCEYAYCRGTSQHLTRRWLERMGGQLQVLAASSAAVGKIQISIQAYQPGTVTTKRDLLELAERTLSEFALTGEFE